ncbi:MAG: hypothetical protein NTV63_03695, partial [Candidatus Woesearchaeota archaeon]|nr:hypothetical protein [Candidatus Woesearchaeota archaeon]
MTSQSAFAVEFIYLFYIFPINETQREKFQRDRFLYGINFILSMRENAVEGKFYESESRLLEEQI